MVGNVSSRLQGGAFLVVTGIVSGLHYAANATEDGPDFLIVQGGQDVNGASGQLASPDILDLYPTFADNYTASLMQGLTR